MTGLDLFVFICVLLMAFFALDDFFIDVMAWYLKARPEPVSDQLRIQLQDYPRKKIAVMVANWKEEDVLEAMVLGNLRHVDYEDFYFFLGVYPNDTATWKKAVHLQNKNPRVIAVTNHMPGPTSKGQMLNVCVKHIFLHEERLGFSFEVIMMHDSEDVIHPKSLQLINYHIQDSDFIQIPVYSFNLPKSEWVGATYLDEFSEHHSKEMILRSKLKLAVPSAGTGTALSRRLVMRLLQMQNGQLMKEDTLTEDYHLGNTSHRLGFRTRFLCSYFESEKGRDFIATREYFPKRFRASIRQKTRWCIGILFQGGKNLNWEGTLWDRYFLFRDRRGLFNTGLVLGSIVVLQLYLARWMGILSPFYFEESAVFHSLLIFNLVGFIWRMSMRMKAVSFVNDRGQALLVPFRWWIANVINTLACLNAWQTFRIAERSGEAPKWVKTQHELPPGFGMPTATAQQNREKIAEF